MVRLMSLTLSGREFEDEEEEEGDDDPSDLSVI